MIMCVLLCYPVSFYMLLLLFTGHPISSLQILLLNPKESRERTFSNLHILF